MDPLRSPNLLKTLHGNQLHAALSARISERIEQETNRAREAAGGLRFGLLNMRVSQLISTRVVHDSLLNDSGSRISYEGLGK
jgi:hypothetical protein